jgi:hypothetical protein
MDSYRKELETKCNTCVYLSNHENRNKEIYHPLTEVKDNGIFLDFILILDILALLSK